MRLLLILLFIPALAMSQLPDVMKLRADVGKRGDVTLSWVYGEDPDEFFCEVIREGSTVESAHYGTIRKLTMKLKRDTEYTFRIQAATRRDFSQWSEISFKTR